MIELEDDLIEVVKSTKNKSFTLYPKTTDYFDVVRVIKCEEDEYLFIYNEEPNTILGYRYFMVILQNDKDSLLNHEQRIFQELQLWIPYKQVFLQSLRWLKEL